MDNQTNPVKSPQSEFNGVNPTNSNKNFLIIAVIIAIIAVGAGGFILGKYYSDISKEAPEVYESGEDASKITEKETGKCASIQNISEKNQCWIDLAKEEKNENYCKKISADFPEIRGDCYTELAILKDDSLICEKVITASLHKSCLEYFEENNEKDETADWKVYKNEKYEIKYPFNWNFYEEKNAVIVTFCGPEYQGDCRMAGKGSNAAIVLRNDSLDIEKENFCQNNPLNIFCDEKILSRENVKVGGKEGEIFNIDVNGNSLYVLWKKNLSDKKMYEMSADELRNFPQHQDVFEQMLSTFKFIETNEISDWKTYENKEYGFEMKYPEDFFPEQVLQPKTEITQCDYTNFVNNCLTKIITVNETPFCLQETSSAAAGTAYATYNYTAIKNKECFVISFTVPYPNCSNFLPIEDQKIQEAYDKCILDNEITKPKIVNQIVSTFKFTD